MPNPACQQDTQETPYFASFTIQYSEIFLWIVVEKKEKVKVPSTPFFLLTGLQTLFYKIWQLIKQLIHVPNVIHGTVNDDANYDGDVGDDIYDGDATYDYDQVYEC